MSNYQTREQLSKRVKELESLLKCVNHNLETIKYSCEVDGSVAGRNLTKECLDWIKDHNIPA